MRSKFYILFIFLLLFVSSCIDTNENYNAEFYDFGEDGMSVNTEYAFYPYKDSLNIDYNKLYSFELIVRYTSRCFLKKLPLNVEYDLNDSIQQIAIDFPLFDETDNVKGKGNFNIFESKCLILKNREPEEGSFISVSTPVNSSEGILSLGIIGYPQN